MKGQDSKGIILRYGTFFYLETLKRRYIMNKLQKSGGIVCDNLECDFTDPTVELSQGYVGTPCPKCGEDLLTQGDYERAMYVESLISVLNNTTPEELDTLSEPLKKEVSKFKEVCANYGIDIDSVPEDANVVMTISSHKEIKITDLQIFPPTWMADQAQNLVNDQTDRNV